MISVAIFINGNFISGRSAFNDKTKNKKGQTLYRCDDGSKIWHNRDEGAVQLAKKMLDTIK